VNEYIPRISNHPVLSPNGLDYIAGHSYEVKQIPHNESQKDTVVVLHRIHGSNLVAKLVNQGKANFACTIVVPSCIYRKVEFAIKMPVENEGFIQVEQEIKIKTQEYCPPLMFQPSVITLKEIKGLKATESHGLHEIWRKKKIRFPIAATIATHSFFDAETIMQSILKFKKVSDGSLKKGSFEVDLAFEQGFYFNVRVEESLYKGLLNPQSFKHRNSIYAMAFSQGLSKLQNDKECSSQDLKVVKDHHNLNILYKVLENRNLKTWLNDDFNPNQVVAEFHPHELDVENNN